MKILKIPIIIIFFIYIALCFFVFFYQKSFIFSPSKDVLEIPKSMNIEEVFFYTDDNIKLNAWYLNNNSKKTVLFFHGNAGNISHRTKQMEVFSELGLNALIFDYRGYGKSEGEIINEEDLYSDAKASLNYLLQIKHLQEKDIIIWGRSLGGAIAIDTAQNRFFSAIVIESSFFSMDEMAKKQFLFLPVNLLSKFHFRSDKKIKNILSKLLIIHSKGDEVIPLENGKKLFDNANLDKEFLEISGSHNNGFIESNSLYIETLKNFLIK